MPVGTAKSRDCSARPNGSRPMPTNCGEAGYYMFSDTNGRGFLKAGGSHAWQMLVNQIAAGVRDPETGSNMLERLRARILVDGSEKGAEEEEKKIAKRLASGGAPPLYPDRKSVV